MFIMILFSLIWFWVQLWNCCFAFVTFKFRVFGLLACGFCNFGLGDIFCCCTLFCSSFLSWDLQKGQSDLQLHFSTDCSLVLGFSSSCYTDTDCVYATDHRFIFFRIDILTLLLLAIMTKNHSCYWSSLVWHSHFSWLCYKLILLSVFLFCHKSENKIKSKRNGQSQ